MTVRAPAPGVGELRALLESGATTDRAFADAVIRMQWLRARDAKERAELSELHAEMKRAAWLGHGRARAAIAAGRLRGDRLRAYFDAVPAGERDHFVEEVLGIAYPPLEEQALGPEQMSYMPSGYDEICHAFDRVQLGPGDRLLDLGSGMGKVTLCAALLAQATCVGVECSRPLYEQAVQASAELAADRASFLLGDAREAPLGQATVVFMYLPFSGSVLRAVMARLMDQATVGAERRYLCSGALDLEQYPRLSPVGTPRSWLNIYAWR